MTRRLAITAYGVVQGVGFRPFVYRLASEFQLSGWVRNGTDGVRIEVQGTADSLASFLEALRTRQPPQAVLERLDVIDMAPLPWDAAAPSFQIMASQAAATIRPSIPPDLATCAECRAEIATSSERRYRYPFTNCTQCGPRYSIIEELPYDRQRTVMKSFAWCTDCAAQYHDPLDRRFHAQPIACSHCGPQLELCGIADQQLLKRREHELAHSPPALRAAGDPCCGGIHAHAAPDHWPGSAVSCLATGQAALEGAIAALLDGKILALKGLG
ncbi:MAG: carbamoyltransferase HypF, partial [Cyanobacteria bacterium NC_groundwater_1444_Ag_S-0.65um_54_12]|nr:carbamoyltransferase HypF [Cyanobacteria bacterium NC_groundwater_1444_Ag_S-0.65um_54_12]